MGVFVDQAGVVYRGKARHHLVADSVDELHAFCARLGIKRCWFHPARQHPHYDVTDAQREAALAAGAQAVSSRVALRSARAAASRPPQPGKPLALTSEQS